MLLIFDRGVTRHDNHWSAVFHTLYERRDGIGQPGTVSHACYAKSPGRFCPALRHAYGVRFVGRSNQVDPVLTFQAFTDEKIAVPENGKDGVNAVVNKGLSYCVVPQQLQVALFVKRTGVWARSDIGGGSLCDPAILGLVATQHRTRFYVHAELDNPQLMPLRTKLPNPSVSQDPRKVVGVALSGVTDTSTYGWPLVAGECVCPSAI